MNIFSLAFFDKYINLYFIVNFHLCRHMDRGPRLLLLTFNLGLMSEPKYLSIWLCKDNEVGSGHRSLEKSTNIIIKFDKVSLKIYKKFNGNKFSFSMK